MVALSGKPSVCLSILLFSSSSLVVAERHLAADAGGLLLGEGGQGRHLGRDHRLHPGVLAAEERRLGLRLAKDRLENPEDETRKY